MITPYSIASKFIGRREIPGMLNDPLIMEWLTLDNTWPTNDETPWCSALTNWICWLCDVQRTKSLMARSWLGIGWHIRMSDARQGYDVVILSRGQDPKHGHVGFYAFHHDNQVWILGGNQGDQVSIQPYNADRVLGVRRLE